MCGIVGIVPGPEGPQPDPAVARRMVLTIRHRGPDGDGVGVFGRAVLAHCRLAVMDPAGGAQPLAGAGGRVGLVFNGEIYNHRELRRDLEAAGHRFRTRCDTEVVLRSWLEWGSAMLGRLRGMFAIAIHDARDGRTFHARDPLGVKPLYWARTRNSLIFASELRALLASGEVRRQVDERSLLDFLNLRYVPAPRTILRDVWKLPAAHALVLAGDRIRVWRYWAPSFRTEEGVARSEWRERVREAVRGAVESEMEADVPLGAFLSGGVDSSAVVALMAAASGKRIPTTTVGFAESGPEDLDWGRFAADWVGTEHREVRLAGVGADALQRLADVHDEPFGDSSAIPTLALAEATRPRVKVALSGDGADEVFAGYRRYRFEVVEHRIRRALPAWARRRIVGPVATIWPRFARLPRPLRFKTLLTNVAGGAEEAYCRSVGTAAGWDRRSLLRGSVREALGGYDTADWLGDLYRNAPAGDALGRAQYVDLVTRIPDGMLAKVDRASMAVGLEVRVPFLDHRLVELTGRIPPGLRLEGGRGKAVLKDALEGTLPRLLLERRKRGFAAPIREWLRGDLRATAEAALLAPDAVVGDWFDWTRIEALWAAHQRGAVDASDLLWPLLAFEVWARRYLRSDSIPAAAGAAAATA